MRKKTGLMERKTKGQDKLVNVVPKTFEIPKTFWMLPNSRISIPKKYTK